MLHTLTERELEVLHHIILGSSDVQISKALNITSHTVKAHVQAILHKLNVKNRVQAAVIASKYLTHDNLKY